MRSKTTRILVATAAILTWFAMHATGASTSVWIFHDEDPDYQNPPFDDTLTALNESGQINLTRTGFNTTQTVGGNRVIATADHGASVLVCEDSFVAQRLSKISAAGASLFSITRPISAIDVAPSGTIFALEDHTGTIYGENILRISPEGEVQNQARQGGFDLVVDEQNQAVFVVGADIKCLDLDLKLLWSLDPIAWVAVSVDRSSDGSVWVVEREHPEVEASANRLLHVSRLGTLLQSIDLTYSPFCVRVDRSDDSVYVAGDRLYKYDPQGGLVFAASLGPQNGLFHPGWSLALDFLGQIWVGTFLEVRKFAPDGTLLLATNQFSYASDTYVAVDQSFADGPLSVLVPRVASESDGFLTGSGQVRLRAALPTNLVVSIAVSATNRLTIIPTVAIPAGQLAVPFDLTLLNNSIQDGDQTVIVTASASGFTNVSSSIRITDDDIAPGIVAQPFPQSTTVHGTANFTVSAIGELPLNYQWLKDGEVVPGATNASYLMVDVQSSDAGNYSVRVTNCYGSVISSNAALTVRSLDYFTEFFSVSRNDLAYSTLTFTPDGSASSYSVCRKVATVFPTDPGGGTVLPPSDDDYFQISLTGSHTVGIYNRRTNVLFIGSNGYVTMDNGDNSYNSSLSHHFDRPRVSALMEDLLPGAGGVVSWKQLSNRVAVTYQHVPHYDYGGANSFQIELFFDGRIRMTYLALTARDGLAGLSAGKGVPPGFLNSNLSSYGPCEILPPQLTFTSDDSGGYIIRLPGVIGLTYELLRAPTLDGPWTIDATVTASAIGSIEFHDTHAARGSFFYRALVVP